MRKKCLLSFLIETYPIRQKTLLIVHLRKKMPIKLMYFIILCLPPMLTYLAQVTVLSYRRADISWIELVPIKKKVGLKNNIEKNLNLVNWTFVLKVSNFQEIKPHRRDLKTKGNIHRLEHI